MDQGVFVKYSNYYRNSDGIRMENAICRVENLNAVHDKILMTYFRRILVMNYTIARDFHSARIIIDTFRSESDLPGNAALQYASFFIISSECGVKMRNFQFCIYLSSQ